MYIHRVIPAERMEWPDNIECVTERWCCLCQVKYLCPGGMSNVCPWCHGMRVVQDMCPACVSKIHNRIARNFGRSLRIPDASLQTSVNFPRTRPLKCMNVSILILSMIYVRHNGRSNMTYGRWHCGKTLALNQTHSGMLQLKFLGVLHVRGNHS